MRSSLLIQIFSHNLLNARNTIAVTYYSSHISSLLFYSYFLVPLHFYSVLFCSVLFFSIWSIYSYFFSRHLHSYSWCFVLFNLIGLFFHYWLYYDIHITLLLFPTVVEFSTLGCYFNGYVPIMVFGWTGSSLWVTALWIEKHWTGESFIMAWYCFFVSPSPRCYLILFVTVLRL